MRALVSAGLALALAGVAAAEIVMAPASRDRVHLFIIFVTMGVGAAALGWLLRRALPKLTSLSTTVWVIGLAALAITVATVVVASVSMFLSAHDLRLVLIAQGLGAGLAAALAATTWRSVAADLDRLSSTAALVAAGDRAITTDVNRADELGSVARAIDDMVQRLADAEELRSRNEQSRRRLLAAIGHDLRTPLTSIRAAVEALQDGMAPDPDAYLRSIAAEATALGTLVDDLFTLARLEAGDVEVDRIYVDLAEIVDEVVESMTPTARRYHVDIRFDAHGPVSALVDPRATSRVLRQLLDNAIGHAPVHTSVHLSLHAGAEPVVRVRDEGPGFPAAFRDRAFDAFSRADEARGRGGAGLGLAIVDGLVRAQGGSIWIEPGPGGCVAVRFASSEDPTACASPLGSWPNRSAT